MYKSDMQIYADYADAVLTFFFMIMNPDTHLSSLC